MLVHPHLSGNKIFIRSLRLQTQDVTGLAVEGRLPDIAEGVIIPADGAAAFIVFGSYFNLMVQHAAYKLLPSAAARVSLNRVTFGSGRPEINFCHHLGISFRI